MRGVLFDLDGTLLDIDLDTFLARYFGALGPVVADVIGTHDHRAALDAVMGATQAMMTSHPGMTNQQVFDVRFAEMTGADIRTSFQVLDDFYAKVFPALGEGMGPNEGAREAVAAARDLGLKVAVATNPIFPAVAVRERLRWAGLGDVAFDVVTTYENMHACKPDPDYFHETAELIGAAAEDCVMVGDDPSLDMPAAATGMFTFYVGDSGQPHGTARGSLLDFAELLPHLAHRT